MRLRRSRHRHRRRLPTTSRAWGKSLVEAGALLLLVATPLAYGTVEPWAEALAEIVILGMALVWLFGTLRQWELRVTLPPGWLPATLFLALVFVQTVPVPRGAVALVSPGVATLAAEAATAVGTAPAGVTLSLDPHATWREGLKLLAVAVFFLVMLNTIRTRAQVHRAIWTMLIMGTVLSLLGIVQRATWTGRLYWVGPEALPSAFGPFVNRTHFAGLMIITVPMALALVLARRRPTSRPPLHRSWGDRLRQWNSTETGPARLIVFLILLMGGATLVSGSRGGVVSLLGALLCMIGLGAQGRSGRGRAARVALTSVLIVLAGLWIGGEILFWTLERLAEEVGRPSESVRVALWGDALKVWAAAPAVGTGFATFEVAFPHVRSLQAPVVFTHAESDWVQLLTDTGVVGLGLALATVGALFGALLRRRAEAVSPWARTLLLAAAVALVGMVLQGMGNFNLPIMSNQLYLALALALALSPGGEGGGRPPREPEASHEPEPGDR